MQPAPDPWLSLLPLFIFTALFAIPVYFIAKEKGLSPVKFTLLALIPGIGWISVWYVIGASNRRVEQKLDAILNELKSRP